MNAAAFSGCFAPFICAMPSGTALVPSAGWMISTSVPAAMARSAVSSSVTPTRKSPRATAPTTSPEPPSSRPSRLRENAERISASSPGSAASIVASAV